MSVRAKFKVQSVTESEGGLKTANLTPVVSGSPENERFFKWTPGGQIQLGTINPDAAAQFVPGREFFVDFSASTDGAPLMHATVVITRDSLAHAMTKWERDAREKGWQADPSLTPEQVGAESADHLWRILTGAPEPKPEGSAATVG